MKNAHLLRYAHPSSLQRTRMYVSFLRISRALHLVVFEEPAENYFFNNLLVPGKIMQVDLRIKSFMKKNMKNLKFP